MIRACLFKGFIITNRQTPPPPNNS